MICGRTSLALLTLAWCAAVGCDDGSANKAGGTGGSPASDGTCSNTLGCPSGLVCDRDLAKCVECVQPGDCAADQICAGNACRATCTSDKQCQSSGLLCNIERGHCVQCLVDSDCTDGTPCSAAGVCGGSDQSGGGGGAGNEGGAGGEAGGGPRGPSTVVVLLDQSSTMDMPLSAENSVSRWTYVLGALTDERGPLAASEEALSLGLYGFTGSEGACPSFSGIAPKKNNFAAISEHLASITLPEKGDTPAGAAIARAADILAESSDAKYLVFITDGQPDTCEMTDPQCGHDAVIDALQDAAKAGVRSFVIGVGEDDPADKDNWLKYLQDAANAGAGQPVSEPSETLQQRCSGIDFAADYQKTGGSAAYFHAPETDVQTALNTIFQRIRGD